MDDNCIVFYGAGKVGKEALWVCRQHNIVPSYYSDSNTEKHGKNIEGVPIISIDEVLKKDNVIIVITCFAENEILEFLVEKGFDSEQIISGFISYSRQFLQFLYVNEKVDRKIEYNVDYKKCIFDFTYGTCLGGVEQWCYSQNDIINKIGYNCIFLGPDISDNTRPDGLNYECIKTMETDIDLEYYPAYCWIESYVRYFLTTQAGNAVINFPREIMLAGLCVKLVFHKNFNIIFVIHNDESIYYERYVDWKDEADYWLTISDRIEERVKKAGISEDRIKRLQWKIPCDNRRKKNDGFHIGFAGRLTKQKRIDLIISVAEILKKSKILFSIEIAGKGEEEKFLIKEIKEKGLSLCVKYIGLVPHDEIMDFWMRQDVCISCSDYEGHSISLCEAMACGTVPVVTDVSGVRDDIIQGENGYIVPIGDVEKMANRIETLYNDALLLENMSASCIRIIKSRNRQIDESLFWDTVLRRK